METSFGLMFYLKKNKAANEAEWFVYFRITVDGKACELSTKRKCRPELWNRTAGRVFGRTDYAKSFNAYLDTLQQKVFEAKRKLIEIDEAYSAEDIKNNILGKVPNKAKHLLMEVFKYHNDQIAALVHYEYSSSTLKRYVTSYQHTKNFLALRYKLNDIDITKLTYEFITEYEFWLKSVRNCNHNTTIKYLSNFRKIINRCVNNGWLVRDPFLGFKMGKKEVDRTALSESELVTIANKKFSIERLSIVKDIFLFSCYTGLAYVDVAKLKHTDIIIGIDGEKWIHVHRTKTDVLTKVPLLPAALNIINQYKNSPFLKSSNGVLPILSNQKMNAYLKEIADVCGITKNLTYHLARHTFATTVTLSNGVPMETVSKMLGHKNIRTTQLYAKIVDKKISEDMKLIREKFL